MPWSNADYSQRGGPVRIAFFDDRIEIENPGILLPGMTVGRHENRGYQRSGNPVIARFFPGSEPESNNGEPVCREYSNRHSNWDCLNPGLWNWE